MKATQKALQTKVAQLQVAAGRTDPNLESGYDEEIVERHFSAIKALTSEADQHKRALEEFKIEAKEDIEGIQQWNSEVDAKIIKADRAFKRLKTALKEYQEEKTRDKQEKQLKLEALPKIGKAGQPGAEKTALGWTIMSTGHEDKLNPMLLTQSTSVDYEQLGLAWLF